MLSPASSSSTIDDQIRLLESSLLSAATALQAAKEADGHSLQQFLNVGKDLTRKRRQLWQLGIAGWHQRNLAKDPAWNWAWIIAIGVVFVGVFFAPAFLLSKSLTLALMIYILPTVVALLLLLAINHASLANAAEKMPGLEREIQALSVVRQQCQQQYEKANQTKLAWQQQVSQITAQLSELKQNQAYVFRQHINQLLSFDWRLLRGIAWEQFLAEVLRRNGYFVELTKSTGDQGVDLVARRNGISIAIQAKGYADKVGNSAIQEAFTGMRIYNCNYCAVITNSEFTSSAIVAAEKTGCVLVSFVEFVDFAHGRLMSFHGLVSNGG